MADYYKVLGIDKNASQTEIKMAFRKLAMKHHPDRHATSSEHTRDSADKRFKDLMEAYEVLSDEKKRRLYNRAGKAGFRPGGSAAQDAYRRAGGSAGRASYTQGPFQGGAYARARAPRWKFVGFGRADYVFQGLIFTVALIGLATAGAAADALWKAQNAGKSFEEAIEAVERKKTRQRVANGEESSSAPG